MSQDNNTAKLKKYKHLSESERYKIRRFIPKGTDIGKISKARIKYIENWINSYSRRIFGCKSANDMAL